MSESTTTALTELSLAVMHDASPVTYNAPRGSETADEVSDLRRRVEVARAALPLQHDPALMEHLSERELEEKRKSAERIRGKELREAEREATAELADTRRANRTARRIGREQAAVDRWDRKATAAQERATSTKARKARTFQRSQISSWVLIGVAIIGLAFSAFNVQRNIAGGTSAGDPMH